MNRGTPRGGVLLSPSRSHLLGVVLCILGAVLFVLEVERWTGGLVAGLVLLYLGTIATVWAAFLRAVGR